VDEKSGREAHCGFSARRSPGERQHQEDRCLAERSVPVELLRSVSGFSTTPKPLSCTEAITSGRLCCSAMGDHLLRRAREEHLLDALGQPQPVRAGLIRPSLFNSAFTRPGWGESRRIRLPSSTARNG